MHEGRESKLPWELAHSELAFSRMSDAIFNMRGTVTLLTGAGRGIGLAMAKAIASAGGAVAIQDIDLAIAQREVDAINQTGGKAIASGGDIADLTLPARLVADVMERLGGLHVLVNNASIQEMKHWMQVTPAEMEAQHRANVISPLLFIQQAVPIFRKQKFGRIVNIGSIQQRGANPDMLPYSLSKGALEKLTKGLARELARDNITMNLIAPGWINTYRNSGFFKSQDVVIEAGKKAVPLGRIGEPEDFAGIALLLCSQAGRYITGQSIFVDGGMSA